MRAVGAAIVVMLWPSLASAQEGRAEPAPPTEVTSAPPAAATQPASKAAALATIVDPAEYGTAFYSGAQAELIAPASGVSSLLVGYDAVWAQLDLSLGVAIGETTAFGTRAEDAWVASLRLGFPVHRGVRADYALFVGGGAALLDPSEEAAAVHGFAGAGARFRVFMTPSVAVAGTLGVAIEFGEERTKIGLGARPLGAASVVYFFR